jgi:hypothetical protein
VGAAHGRENVRDEMLEGVDVGFVVQASDEEDAGRGGRGGDGLGIRGDGVRDDRDGGPELSKAVPLLGGCDDHMVVCLAPAALLPRGRPAVEQAVEPPRGQRWKPVGPLKHLGTGDVVDIQDTAPGLDRLEAGPCHERRMRPHEVIARQEAPLVDKGGNPLDEPAAALREVERAATDRGGQPARGVVGPRPGQEDHLRVGEGSLALRGEGNGVNRLTTGAQRRQRGGATRGGTRAAPGRVAAEHQHLHPANPRKPRHSRRASSQIAASRLPWST